ncbi:hypothetical protein AYO20_03590 [Fonsecaea nubica]|uniref:C2H2-type domain-containing protein n=1 Tax=Fonsecaea nubica TaxID=856822 RepID=A0A178D7C7_9EURO|nr:hypothetical protein AYO20_03590 [Fonsecaea nubica]OAL37113.1 hypothetical protein AYO20_03590 [Fonsecaea nubica]
MSSFMNMPIHPPPAGQGNNTSLPKQPFSRFASALVSPSANINSMSPASPPAAYSLGRTENSLTTQIAQAPSPSTPNSKCRCSHGNGYYDDGEMTPKQRSEAEKRVIDEIGGLFCDCGKFFAGKYAKTNLTRHLREQGTRLRCTYCQSEFARPGNLHNHILEKHPQQVCTHCGMVPPQRFKCPKCSRVFQTMDDLHRHLHTKHRNDR